ncbi:MAG: histidinol-phosphate transaminase [Fibromonadaceae bacterium]|jgi:histidinol-phosphate aminotransferase|nr:histidinol-phosphate transaminase [Fibromonadaceae bacterium]
MLQPRKELAVIPEYVPGKSIDEIKEKYKLKQVIKLASNENPLGASPMAKVAYKKCVENLRLYPRGTAPELIKKLAKKWKLKEENLIAGNGSDEILDLATRAFLNKGDYAVGASSTFSVYSSATQIAGAKYKAFPLEDFYYPLETMLSFEKAKIIFICNPNNPTGTYISNKRIYEFLTKVPKHILVVLDMAYWEFTAEKEPPLNLWIKQFPNLLCTRTFSKLYGLAGLRIGYGIASEQVISALSKIKPPFNTNYPAQIAAAAALDDTSFVEKSLEMNRTWRSLLLECFEFWGFDILPSGANFICVKFGKKAAEFVARLESKGLVVRHLKSFGMPEWVRITVGTKRENETLLRLISGIIK